MRSSDGAARLALKAATASSTDKWSPLGLLLIPLAQVWKEKPAAEAAGMAVERVAKVAARTVDLYMAIVLLSFINLCVNLESDL